MGRGDWIYRVSIPRFRLQTTEGTELLLEFESYVF
jgi:hypothetical protein